MKNIPTTPDADLTGPAVQAIANLATEAANAKNAHARQSAEKIYRLGDNKQPYRIKEDGSIEDMSAYDTEQNPMKHIEASPVFRDAESFIAYVGRYKDERTLITVDDTNLNEVSYYAAIDYHSKAGSKFECGNPEWNAHRATLNLTPTPDWSAWSKHNRIPITQEQLAEFVQEQSRCFVKPDALQMQELCEKFEFEQSVTFKKGTMLSTGTRVLEYRESTDGASNKVNVPTELMITVKPFDGSEPVNVRVFFRFTVRGPELRFVMVLDRPDLIVRAAAASITEQIKTELGCPVLAGSLSEY